MTIWPKITIRTIALANIVMGAMGLFLQIDSLIRFYRTYQFTVARPYEAYAYWVIVCIGFVFVSLTLLSGFFLWQTGPPTLRFCNWLFGSQLAYWVGSSMLVVILVTFKREWAHRFVMSIAAERGMGNVGLAPR